MIIMPSQGFNMQLVWKSWTLEARCHGGVPKGQEQPNKGTKKGKSRRPKKIDDVGTDQDYHLTEVDIASVSQYQYQPQQQE